MANKHGERVHELIREAQRQNRYIIRFNSSNLGLGGGQIAVLLARHGALSPGELSDYLALDRSTMSRSLSRLEKLGYVQMVKAEDDGRRRNVTLTSAGREQLAISDRVQNELLDGLCSRISQSEVFELRDFFKALCDGCSAPPSPIREGEHFLREEVRRIAWIADLFKDVVMGSEIGATYWQVLTEVLQGEGEATPSLVADRLFLPKNTVSQILAALQLRGYLSREKRKSDKRISNLSLTADGKKVLKKIERVAAKRYQDGLASLDTASIEAGIALFEKFLALDVAKEGKEILSPRVYMQQVRDVEGLREARSFVLIELVKQSMLENVPALILPEGSSCFLLRFEDHIAGLCAFSNSEEKKDVTFFLTRESLVSNDMASSFFEYCLGKLNLGNTEIDMSKGLVSKHLLSDLAKASGGL